MDVTPLIREGAQIVQSYADGQFRVSGAVYEGAILVFPEQTLQWNYKGDVSALSEDDFEVFSLLQKG